MVILTALPADKGRLVCADITGCVPGSTLSCGPHMMLCWCCTVIARCTCLTRQRLLAQAATGCQLLAVLTFCLHEEAACFCVIQFCIVIYNYWSEGALPRPQGPGGHAHPGVQRCR